MVDLGQKRWSYPPFLFSILPIMKLLAFHHATTTASQNYSYLNNFPGTAFFPALHSNRIITFKDNDIAVFISKTFVQHIIAR